MAEVIRDPFVEAHNLAQSVVNGVQTNQAIMIARATEMRTQAMSVMAEMGSFKPELHMEGGPEIPEINFTGPRGNLDLPDIDGDAFGKIAPGETGPFTPTLIAPITSPSILPFDFSFEGIRVPDAPTPRDFGPGPSKPVLTPVVTPDVPVLNRPVLPAMLDVVIPDFTFPELPTFDATAPEFQGSFVSTVLQWTETPYEIEILDEVMDKLRLMWAGGTGLPPAVEQALWERAASREDIAISRDVSAAAIEFSGRGYTLPPGMLANRIDTIRMDGALRKQSLGRDILIKVTDVQIENLRFACTQAIAAEQVLVSIWTTVAARAFEAAKIQLDSQLSLLNAHIAIFNARQSAYATEATVYRARLDGQLSRLQVMRMELDAELAKGTINEQRVRVYAEMTRALIADIEIYKAQMQGAQLQSELQRNEVELFKSEVQAYAEQLQSDKNRFEVFESQVRGETAKAAVVESQARGYAAYISGQATIADIAIKNQQADIARADIGIREFMARLEKDKVKLQAELGAVQANAEAHRANSSRFVASAQAKTAAFEVEGKLIDANNRSAIAIYEVETRKHIADMEQMIRVAGLQLEAIKGAAQVSSTLAAGAMAGISISSNASGSGSINASGSRSDVTNNTPTEF